MMSRIVANGMIRTNTPIEDHTDEWGLWVKREDKSCTPPGPFFSKARGVYAHVMSRPEKLIGVLDTRHSQGGHAVARACNLLGKECWVFYPELKYEPGPKPPQLAAQREGADLIPLTAGMSAVLYHIAKGRVRDAGGYMMPNALKLAESVAETAKEVPDREFDLVLVPASSATIAAGVIAGLVARGHTTRVIVHLGYSRSMDEVSRYLAEASQCPLGNRVRIVDEMYRYKDKARSGPTPGWPCNAYYDLKAFRWWVKYGKDEVGEGRDVLLWNIG